MCWMFEILNLNLTNKLTSKRSKTTTSKKLFPKQNCSQQGHFESYIYALNFGGNTTIPKLINKPRGYDQQPAQSTTPFPPWRLDRRKQSNILFITILCNLITNQNEIYHTGKSMLRYNTINFFIKLKKNNPKNPSVYFFYFCCMQNAFICERRI